ncbi:hypothetical protein AT6N2_C2543 [Agrobacterium tumefaciens]|nr:hypothetical protein AT6N2_C2543 [Agrobacterium tumefaciens]
MFMLIEDEHHLICLHAVAAPGRFAADGAPSGYFAKAKTRGDGLASCIGATLDLEQRWNTDRSQKDV